MSIRHILLSLSTIGLGFTAAIPAFAQQDLIGPASVELQSFESLEAILRDHPALSALGSSALADRGRAEGALGLPDPVVSLGLNNFPIFSPSLTEYLPTHKYVGVRQAIPNSAKRKAGSLKSLRSAAKTELETEMQFQSLRGQLIQLLIEQQKIDQLRAIAVKRDRKYQELSDIIEIEINAGRSVIFRLAEVEVERAEVSRKLSELDGAEAEIEAQLINLVGFAPKVKAPDLSLQPWSGNALAFYAVRVADAGVNIMDAAVQQAEADFKPDWGVNLTYQQRESGRGAPRSNFDGDDWVSGGVSFTIPFWADKKQEPNLRAAKNDRESARYNRMDVARRVLSQWKRFDARRTVAAENIKIFDTKIGAIDSRIASQLITYETGAGDYSPIIDGEIAILKLREQIVTERALRDQAIAHMNSLLVGASS